MIAIVIAYVFMTVLALALIRVFFAVSEMNSSTEKTLSDHNTKIDKLSTVVRSIQSGLLNVSNSAQRLLQMWGAPQPSRAPTPTPKPPNQTPSRAPTQTPTQPPTQPPSQPPTQPPSQHPTPNPYLTPSQAPSQTPIPSQTLNPSQTPNQTLNPSQTPSHTLNPSQTLNPSINQQNPLLLSMVQNLNNAIVAGNNPQEVSSILDYIRAFNYGGPSTSTPPPRDSSAISRYPPSTTGRENPPSRYPPSQDVNSTENPQYSQSPSQVVNPSFSQVVNPSFSQDVNPSFSQDVRPIPQTRYPQDSTQSSANEYPPSYSPSPSQDVGVEYPPSYSPSPAVEYPQSYSPSPAVEYPQSYSPSQDVGDPLAPSRGPQVKGQIEQTPSIETWAAVETDDVRRQLYKTDRLKGSFNISSDLNNITRKFANRLNSRARIV